MILWYWNNKRIGFRTRDIQGLSKRGEKLYGYRLGSPSTYDRQFREMKEKGLIDVEEQTCEINLYGINIGTNNTSAVVFYDLDCGTEQNDLDGYNVSVQFLVYTVNSSNGTNPPIEYNTSLHYVQGYEDDTHMLRLNNFTNNNTTHISFTTICGNTPLPQISGGDYVDDGGNTITDECI